MNIVKHRVYKLEFDVWEPTEGKAQIEIDAILQYVIHHSSHMGNLRFRMESEERQ